MTFHMWSPLHYAFIASPFVFSFLFYFIFRGRKNTDLRTIGIIFSIIGVLLLIARNLSIYLANQKITPEVIPFQLCHFGNIVLLFAFLFDNELLFTMSFCFNLPAALCSIVFANSLTNYTTLFSWQAMAYLWGHMLIVGITLWAFFNNLIKINLKMFYKMLRLITVLFILSVPVNNLFIKWMPGYESNYFYTMAPESGTPLQTFFEMGKNVTVWGMTFNPIYILLVVAFGFAVVLMFYIIYIGLTKLKKKL